MGLPRRIVCGGQTGADRGALDAALELRVDVGGWIPEGRWTEAGPLPTRYPGFRETDSAEPSLRTELNVRDSDATLIVSHGAPAGGSRLALETARRLSRPVLHLDLDALAEDAAAATLSRWLADTQPQTLNVAGPRQSEDPRIYEATRRVLLRVLSPRG
jgi:hypothetical protein